MAQKFFGGSGSALGVGPGLQLLGLQTREFVPVCTEILKKLDGEDGGKPQLLYPRSMSHENLPRCTRCPCRSLGKDRTLSRNCGVTGRQEPGTIPLRGEGIM